MLNNNIKIDLHIHSKASFYKDGDIVKNSDKEHVDILLSKLKENNISLFSITDHNRFDYSLFTIFRDRCRDNGLYNLPGVEFDVKLDEGMKKCHIVAIFDDSDLEKVSQIKNGIDSIKTLNQPEEYYSLEEFEKILRAINIKVILIVHQRKDLNLKKGNSQSLSESTSEPFQFLKVGFIDSLEYNFPKTEGIVKNCLRDVNLDFPLITGSDCHDWEVYPYHDKKSDKRTRDFTQFKCLPTFKGLLLAITSFSTRVNRLQNDNPNYIKSILLNGEEYPLANGINAIIGDNGAGKTLLYMLLPVKRLITIKNTSNTIRYLEM